MDCVIIIEKINKMNKVIMIIGVLLTTSCGMFSKMTEAEQDLNYKLEK